MNKTIKKNERGETNFYDYKGKEKYIITYYIPTDEEDDGFGHEWILLATDYEEEALACYYATPSSMEKQFCFYELKGDDYEIVCI